MSRIGKKPIPVPAGVKVNVAANRAVTVEGKLGKLEYTHRPEITVKVDGSTVVVLRARFGRTRSPRLPWPDPGADQQHVDRRRRRL